MNMIVGLRFVTVWHNWTLIGCERICFVIPTDDIPEPETYLPPRSRARQSVPPVLYYPPDYISTKMPIFRYNQSGRGVGLGSQAQVTSHRRVYSLKLAKRKHRPERSDLLEKVLIFIRMTVIWIFGALLSMMWSRNNTRRCCSRKEEKETNKDRNKKHKRIIRTTYHVVTNRLWADGRLQSCNCVWENKIHISCTVFHEHTSGRYTPAVQYVRWVHCQGRQNVRYIRFQENFQARFVITVFTAFRTRLVFPLLKCLDFFLNWTSTMYYW